MLKPHQNYQTIKGAKKQNYSLERSCGCGTYTVYAVKL